MRETTDFDLTAPAFHADPFPTLDRLREVGPLAAMKLPIFGRIRLAVTHEACSALLKDHATFVRDPGNAGRKMQARIVQFLPRTLALIARNMLSLDDPDHRRLRGLVDQAFQRRTIEALRPTIVQVADRLLDRFEERNEVDLMAEFCRDLPLSVICALLGLPEGDHDRFKGWLGGLKDTANIGAVVRAIPGLISVIRYLRRQSRPGSSASADGLIAALRDVELDGGRLSEDEFVAMIFLLFAAGQETTTHLLGGGLLALLTHAGQRSRLVEDMSQMSVAVEECLRYVSPVQFTKPRWAARDVEFAGVRLRRGDSVAGFLSAANCDPAKFTEPHRFDIGRRPNPHLAFGTGVHFCLGFQLARAEAAIGFERLFVRFPKMSLGVDPGAIVWRRRLGLRALASLPVRLAA
jgi:cytochrome P450